MEIDADEDRGDFHEFQLLHHHSRFRRSAAEPQQCRPLKCNGESNCGECFFYWYIVPKVIGQRINSAVYVKVLSEPVNFLQNVSPRKETGDHSRQRKSI